MRRSESLRLSSVRLNLAVSVVALELLAEARRRISSGRFERLTRKAWGDVVARVDRLEDLVEDLERQETRP